MVTSLGHCCWPVRRVPQSPICWSSCKVRGKMREGGENDSKGMVSNVEGVQSLGGTEMLSSMRDGICAFVAVVVVAVVVVVVALMVVVEMVVLMIAVGVVVLVIVVIVLCIGMVVVLCIGVVEVDYAGVVDILVLGEVFMVKVMEGVELVVRCVMRLVLWCANGRGYFLCCFSLILVKMNGLNVGGCLF